MLQPLAKSVLTPLGLPNGVKTLLANGWSKFFINSKPVFSNAPRSLARNHPDCTILDSWDFDSLISADK